MRKRWNHDRPDSDFVERVHAHQGILHRICQLYTSGVQDREDLFQEIMYQLWRSYPSFDGRSKFSTWMYRVALNTALLGQRARARRKERVSRTGDLPERVVTADPHDDEEVELLYRCIRRLPELDRAIILLQLDRHSYEEIAAITGLTRANVSVRLVRIRAKLKEMFDAAGYRGE